MCGGTEENHQKPHHLLMYDFRLLAGTHTKKKKKLILIYNNIQMEAEESYLLEYNVVRPDDVSRHFGGPYCIHLHGGGLIQTRNTPLLPACFILHASETPVDFHWTT
jgi:hypothetical protein